MIAIEADRVADGAGLGDQFGRSVLVIGDVTGDGAAEYAVGSRGIADPVSNAGRVDVFDGATGAFLYSVHGEASGDSFSEAIGRTDDIDGDTYPDFVVGAWGNSAGGAAAGRAYVFSGADGALLRTLTGASAGDNFGDAVCGAGDVNNDGTNDIIVGAPTHDSGGSNTGRVYVVSGADWTTLHIFDGTQINMRLGVDVCGVGDLNMDGFDDVLVGSHLYDITADPQENTGRAIVFSGKDGDILYDWTGESPGDNFGWAVAPAGDINNDDRPDIVIGAPLNDARGSNTGRVYVYNGATGSLLHVLTGEFAVDKLGLSVASAGDVNEDGCDDILSGAWWYDFNGIPNDNRGRAYIFSGCTGDVLHTFTGDAPKDHLGRPVHGGDINGDGRPDILVGARDVDGSAEDTGRVFVFLAPHCRGDFDGNAAIDIFDLLAMLAGWGSCSSQPGACAGDVDANRIVDEADLIELLERWGACSEGSSR